MSFALIQNGQVVAYPYSLTTFRTDNPDVSLPLEPTEVQLNEQGIYKVTPTHKPTIDEKTQFVVESTPRLDGNVYIQVWDIIQFTQPEIEANTQSQWAKVRAQRDTLLTACDWTQLPDVPLDTEQKQAWVAYRQALRDVTDQVDPYNIEWPTL